VSFLSLRAAETIVRTK